VINADNGPESNGHRTQWLKRLVELCDAHQLNLQLAYYPPSHPSPHFSSWCSKDGEHFAKCAVFVQ
jgi:hypothetical protein